MHVLSRLPVPFLFSALLFSCSALHNSNNRENTDEFRYGPDSTYARAVAFRNDKLYVGSSNGIIYRLDLSNRKSKALTAQTLPEIRDIAVTGNKRIIGMQSGDTSRMVYLEKGKEQIFSVSETPVFLDGMDILPSGIGFMMGDPADGFFSLFKTSDSGKSWTKITPGLKAENGEAGFAASGTNVQCLNDSTFIFVSGGMQSRFFKTNNSGQTWSSVILPFERSAGSGPFSVHFMNEKDGVAVGGDYTKPSGNVKTSFYTEDGGATWRESRVPVLGYRSCVVEMNAILYACGTTGIDLSLDNGIIWESHAEGNYIALIVAGNRMFATVPHGKIMEIHPLDLFPIY